MPGNVLEEQVCFENPAVCRPGVKRSHAEPLKQYSLSWGSRCLHSQWDQMLCVYPHTVELRNENLLELQLGRGIHGWI